MKKTISPGRSDFTKMINKNNFYVDKTRFIVEWYKEDKDVTLITRPRRFGKTLTLSMMERFFSLKYANQDEIFHGLDVSTDPEIMKLQGTMPVIKMSFSSMNPKSYDDFLDSLSAEVVNAYKEYQYLLNDDIAELDKEEITTIIKPRLNNEKKRVRLSNTEIYLGIKELCRILFEKYDQKALVLLDEYDTPLQTAYVEGYWKDACGFITQMFDAIFKTNDYIEYGIITGITRIAKESIFSKLNNLDVCTVNTNKYEDIFGFTEQEVIDWLWYYSVSDRLDEVRYWYDGYRFGSKDNMYNPFSFANYLDKKKPGKYWANVSSNALISDLLRNGNVEVKKQCEELLQGRSIEAVINEEVTFNDLRTVQDSTISLMVASGYLKAKFVAGNRYQLSIVNHEVSEMMDELIVRWFGSDEESYRYTEFLEALIIGDLERMQNSFQELCFRLFSFFDGQKKEGEDEPEKFYHGFVLGLIVSLRGRYVIHSNQESGEGRYDISLEPLKDDDAILIEFKIFNSSEEKDLEGTCKRALKQIDEKKYDTYLLEKGIPIERIKKYGFGFKGKHALIRSAH